MTFEEFRRNRLEELRKDERTISGGDIDQVNGIHGLIELVQLAKPKSVIEVGTNRGVSAEVFALHCERVVCVDSWEGAWASTLGEFMGRVAPYPHVTFVHASSPAALDLFKDGEFDFCYIDGDHSYDPVVKDINACKRVVAAGGWMAGHDYNGDVEKAVKELLGEPQVFSDTSWLIKKQ